MEKIFFYALTFRVGVPEKASLAWKCWPGGGIPAAGWYTLTHCFVKRDRDTCKYIDRVIRKKHWPDFPNFLRIG
jgi:hypothetical protein